MSDPVTNVEIEDVLASIRRLVSEDSRPETPVQDMPGKLVLTPALRVSDAAGSPEPAPAGRGGPAAPVMELGPQYVADDDYAEDAEEPQPLESADLEARFADMAEDDQTAEVVTVGAAAAPLDDDVADPRAGAVSTPPEAVEWEDIEPDDDDAGTDWRDESDAAGYDAAALDTATEEYAGEGFDAEAYREETEDEADFEDFEDLAEVDDDDAGILDEEALRELVADIVREELQGALGERITRNVRKLVRREIHRALTAQDLQ